ncbi:MAG: hypothetical protein IIB78_05530 [Proteobacteria bacterium]|nr:hypothetical protein [Pseudomonadota bacterium]
MNADNVNRWLTLGANVGVVIGLILLLVELAQNNDLVRAQIHQARSDQHVVSRFDYAESEFLLPAWVKFEAGGGLRDLSAMDNLTPIEAARVTEFFKARHQDYDNLFYQYQQGYLDEEFYRHRVEPTVRLYAPWWKTLKLFENENRRPSFNSEIERIMAGN